MVWSYIQRKPINSQIRNSEFIQVEGTNKGRVRPI